MKNRNWFVMIRYVVLFVLIGATLTSYANNFSNPPIRFNSKNNQQSELLLTFEKKINKSKLDSLTLMPALKTIELELRSKGFLTASYDSVSYTTAEIIVYWSLGKQYTFSSINIKKDEQDLLSNLGYRTDKAIFTPDYYSKLMNALVKWGCNNGYPFALARLENVQLNDDSSDFSADLLLGLWNVRRTETGASL